MALFSFRLLLLATTASVIGCAPAALAPTLEGSGEGQPAEPSRTLRLVIRAEPGSIAGTILIPTGISTGSQRRIFNAGLALEDGEGRFQPYLADGVPELNTESWRVFPDGQMETRYRLKPNLSWHDGTPLAAADFVFAYQVYTSSQFGISRSFPHAAMAEVRAPDAQTVVIRWGQLYPDATELGSQELAPLPRHLLERTFEAEPETFDGLPFWTTEYVGAGPFRLDRWEAGAFIEAVAFDAHVLGRPKINRVKITWNADFNTNLATLLAGEADMPVDDSIRVDQGLLLEREWAARSGGTVQYRPHLPRFVQVQHRAEYANPPAVRDVRVRRALSHAIDKGAINETLFEGKGITSDSLIYPTLDFYPLVDRAVPKYPFDLRRTEQLMLESGYAKDTGGFWASPTEGRLNLEVRNIQSAQNDAERAILADSWRRAGFEVTEDVFTPAQTRDGQTLGTFRALSITSAAAVREGLKIEDYTCDRASRPETRWFGQNRGGWCNPQYDRLVEGFLATLERSERNQLVAQAVTVLTEDLGLLPLHFNPQVIAFAAGVRGVNVKVPAADLSWNIQEWEFRA
jgi:ABC-type transport system substrate-binding protein